MKICPKCRSTYSEEMKFCKKCGTPLAVMAAGVQGQNMRQRPAGVQGQNMQQRPAGAQNQNMQQRPAGAQRQNVQQRQGAADKKKKKPALLIAIIAAILIVVAAVILALFKFTDIFDSGSSPTRVEDDDRDRDEDADDTDESSDEADESETESETEAWETADINAVDEEIQTIRGSLSKNGEAYELCLDEAMSFYVNDMEGTPVLLDTRDKITVSVADNSYKMYADHEVSVTGSMFLDGEDLIILLEEIEALDLDTNPLVEVSVGTHNYEIIMSNGTWQDAFNECIERGGYLARIDSAEEYDKVVSMIKSAGNPSETHYYLGGRRDSDGTEYYWVDTDNEFTGELLNSADSWTSGYWFKGEPSFKDAGTGQYNGIEEAYLNLFCVNGVWYLNDGSGDFYGNYTSLLSGKIGYVMEYE